jgi:adenylosuccinate lyase
VKAWSRCACHRRAGAEHKYTPTIGRTHGIHAEPMTFGLKLAMWHEEMNRNIERMDRAIERISFGKISGAVGTYANIDPFVERMSARKWG